MRMLVQSVISAYRVQHRAPPSVTSQRMSCNNCRKRSLPTGPTINIVTQSALKSLAPTMNPDSHRVGATTDLKRRMQELLKKREIHEDATVYAAKTTNMNYAENVLLEFCTEERGYPVRKSRAHMESGYTYIILED